MKATTLDVQSCGCKLCASGSGGCRDYPDGKIPAGMTREHPDAWKLVRMGVAVSADAECEKKVNMTDLQLAQVQHAQRRVRAGIHPDDYAAFDAGEMIGYYPDGSFIPGPNASVSEGGILLDDHDLE